MYLINSNLIQYDLKNFIVETITIKSKYFKKNKINDSNIKHNQVLIPRFGSRQNLEPLKVCVVLSGFGSAGSFLFNEKFIDLNFVKQIDRAVSKGEAPACIYLFVDAMTILGGAQYISGSTNGEIEKYIMCELLDAITSSYDVCLDNNSWAIMGVSSGGYGALSLSSQYPNVFGHCFAIAPDCDFEKSLMNDLLLAIPVISKYKTISNVVESVLDGTFKKNKNYFNVLNAIAMSVAYSPAKNKMGFDFPLDFITGDVKSRVWARWMKNDPIYFLRKRTTQLKRLKSLIFYSAKNDQFHLQLGVNKICIILKANGVKHKSIFVDGDHFSISEHRISVLKYLQNIWKT